jgi:hypothetical protein
MKYMMLIRSNSVAWDALPAAESERVIRDHFVLIDELERSGELVDWEGLSRDGRVVRVEGRLPAVTDGPFVEAKEQLAGVYVVECEGMERAVEIATPLAQHASVEIRPVMAKRAGS